MALLDTLPVPSADEVDKVYHHLKDILGYATTQQEKSSLQQWAELSTSSPGLSKASRKRTTTEHPTARTTTSPAQVSTRLRSGHPSGHHEPPTLHQAHQGDEGVRSEHHMHNPHCGRRNDRERCDLNPEGPEARAQSIREKCAPCVFPDAFSGTEQHHQV
jgi:hypothetical protein